MIRNLKVLLAAAMALAAFGALGASNAQAVPEFHCDVEPCRYTVKKDGTGKTAHQVFVIKDATGASLSTTCNEITGHATTNTKTATELTITGIEYHGCSSGFGGAVVIRMNGCDYDFTSHGEKRFRITCPAGKVIEKEIVATGCLVTIPATVGELKHVFYHNIGIQANNTTEITVEPVITEIPVIVHGTKAQCGIDPTKLPIIGEITTANFLLTAETHAGEMRNAWWE